LANADVIAKANSQTWMFWILPLGITPQWGSILHKGASNEQRNLGIWFHPGRTRLHVRSGTRRGWNDGADPDPEQDLVPFEWSHVAVTHTEGHLRVYLNGNQVSQTVIPSPLTNDGPLYLGDPWYDAALAFVSDVRFVDSALDATEVKKVFFQRKYHPYLPKPYKAFLDAQSPVQGKILLAAQAQQLQTDIPAYTYAFWLKVNSVQASQSNILHKGNVDQEKSPSIGLYPGESRLSVRSGTADAPLDGCDPKDALDLGTWYHVVVSHKHTKLDVYLNGSVRCTQWMPQPVMNSGPLYFSNPWYPASDVAVGDLRIIRGPVDRQRVAEIMAENKEKFQ